MEVLQPLINRLRAGVSGNEMQDIINDLQTIENLQSQNFSDTRLKQERDAALEESRTLRQRCQDLTNHNKQLQGMVDAARAAPTVQLVTETEGAGEAMKKEIVALKQAKQRWDSAVAFGAKVLYDPTFHLFAGDLPSGESKASGNEMVDAIALMAEEIRRLRSNQEPLKDAQTQWHDSIKNANRWVGEGGPLSDLLGTSTDVLNDGLRAMGNEVIRLRATSKPTESLQREFELHNAEILKHRDRFHRIEAAIRYWTGPSGVFGAIPISGDDWIVGTINALGQNLCNAKAEIRNPKDTSPAPKSIIPEIAEPTDSFRDVLSEPMKLALWNEASRIRSKICDSDYKLLLDVLKFQATLLDPQTAPVKP